jgi:D-alanine--D-alanine ligase
MSRKKIGVIRGGPSSEYDVSLKSGQAVLKHLPNKYEVIDIFIDKDGQWHYNGLPVKPEDIFHKLDVVFNALHGEFGEDGKIQQLMDQFGVKYTGSQALASALGMNKIQSKKIFKNCGLKTPFGMEFRKGDSSIEEFQQRIFRTMPLPVIIKPADKGSSVGVTKAKNFEEIGFGLTSAFAVSDLVMAEEFISGKEATCGVVSNFRGCDVYSLMPVEIRQPDPTAVFSYDEKYSGATLEVCPGNFSAEEKKILQEAAAIAHKSLGLRHYSRSDFIVSPKRGVYILETNTLPDLTEHSLLPKSLAAIGCTLADFFEHLIQLTMKGK